MVVSGGIAHSVIGRSSKPTTLRSSGMRSPASAAAWYTPIASPSLQAKIAVGRRSRRSSWCVKRRPSSIWKSPTHTSAGSTGTPAMSMAARCPSSLARLESMCSGPVITAMRRCPRSRRWRVAVRPPFQFAAPTEGAWCSGSPVGSSRTSGMPLLRSRALCSSSSREKTEMTPVGRRASTSSTQPRPGVWRPSSSETTGARRCSRATRATPLRISMPYRPRSSWKTTSMSGAGFEGRFWRR